MTFAIKEKVLPAISFFLLKKKLFKNHLEPFPDCQNVFLHSLGFKFFVELTMNMAEYAFRWQSAFGAAYL